MADETYKLRLDGNLVVWERSGHYMVGGMGRMNRSIGKIGKIRGCEAELDAVDGRYGAWAGFHFDPPANIVLARDERGDANIIALSMNMGETKCLVKRLAYMSGLAFEEPDENFIVALRASISGYRGPFVKDAPEWMNKYIEKYFGASQYAIFLSAYKGMPYKESAANAARTFAVDFQNPEKN